MEYLSGKLIKRSIRIAGHATSVSLEGQFWDCLATIAQEQSKTLAFLIAEIDEKRGTNLSSALRLYVLNDLQQKIRSTQ